MPAPILLTKTAVFSFNPDQLIIHVKKFPRFIDCCCGTYDQMKNYFFRRSHGFRALILLSSTFYALICYPSEIRLASHKFDSDVWPIEGRELEPVILITSADEARSHSVCLYEGSRKFFQGQSEALALGKACGILVVALRTLQPLSVQEKSFFLAHESFHLSGQILSSKLDIDYFLSPRPNPPEDDLEKALQFLTRLSSGNGVCHEMKMFAQNLPEASVAYINYYSVVEWPAEYYASKVLMKSEAISVSNYSAMRKRFGLYYEYFSGFVVGTWLDENVFDWRRRVSRGEPMLRIASEKCGVDWSISSPQVLWKVDLMPAFGEK